jgi:hypothetical protein
MLEFKVLNKLFRNYLGGGGVPRRWAGGWTLSLPLQHEQRNLKHKRTTTEHIAASQTWFSVYTHRKTFLE